MNDRESKTAKIRELNDQLRTTFTGGQVYMTAGIAALPEAVRAEVVSAVQEYNAFDEDNDPHGEHDFGVVQIAALKLFFKIDVYDLRLKCGSPDATDPAVSCRVLTIMLAEEY